MREIPKVDLTSPSPVTPETMAMLNDWRTEFSGGKGVVIKWLLPEVAVLEHKKILIGPSGPYWVQDYEPVPKYAGVRKRAVTNVMEEIEQSSYAFGGEEGYVDAQT